MFALVNGRTHVDKFTCMHSNQAVCSTVWVTGADVGVINAA